MAKTYTITFNVKEHGKALELTSDLVEQFTGTTKKGTAFTFPRIFVPLMAIKGSKLNLEYHKKLAAKKAGTTKKAGKVEKTSSKPAWMA